MRVPAANELGWLLAGTPPRWIGHGGGPLTVLRTRRHRRLTRAERPIRLCLLEGQTSGLRFAAQQAWFVNERSRVCSAVVDDPAGADVVWVYSQDPLEPGARRRVDEALRTVRPGTPVLNRPEHYDAYHRDDAFPRLAAAGVRVPRHTFAPADEGRVEVVYKAQGEQGSQKFRAVYRGPVEGFRPFELEDGGAADGWVRRYRAWYLAGEACPEQVIRARGWNSALGSIAGVERTFELTPHEVDQLSRVAGALRLDFFAVDFLRRRRDGAPVFVDVNVYPTPTEAYTVGLRGRGTWHIWDAARRAGLPPAHGRDPWSVFDTALTRLLSEAAPREQGVYNRSRGLSAAPLGDRRA